MLGACNVRKSLGTLILVLGVLAATGAHANRGDNIALCAACATPEQFHDAARLAAGTLFAGQRVVLVVNPDINVAMRVRLARPVHAANPSVPPVVPAGGCAVVFSDQGAAVNIYRVACDGSATSSGPTTVRDAASLPTPGKSTVTPGELVALTNDVSVVVLPRSPWFSSYREANQRALGLELQYAANRGPVEPALHDICTIFNNGDSACYRPPGAAPAASGQEGKRAASADDGGRSTGMAIVNKSTTIEYGAPGSKGHPGESWLICDSVDDLIAGCHVATR